MTQSNPEATIANTKLAVVYSFTERYDATSPTSQVASPTALLELSYDEKIGNATKHRKVDIAKLTAPSFRMREADIKAVVDTITSFLQSHPLIGQEIVVHRLSSAYVAEVAPSDRTEGLDLS